MLCEDGLRWLTSSHALRHNRVGRARSSGVMLLCWECLHSIQRTLAGRDAALQVAVLVLVFS